MSTVEKAHHTVEPVLLPSSTHLDAMRSAVDSALRVLAEDLRPRVEAAMKAALGDAWRHEYKRMSGERVESYDPQFLLKYVRGNRRKVFPQAGSELIEEAIRRALSIRNDLYHHTTEWKPEYARDAVSALLRLAGLLGLECQETLLTLMKRLDALGNGTLQRQAAVTEQDYERLKRELAVARAEAERVVAEKQQKDAEVEALADQLADTAERIRADRAQQAELRRRLEAAEEDSAEKRELETRLDKLGAELAKASSGRDLALKRQAKVQGELEAQLAAEREAREDAERKFDALTVGLSRKPRKELDTSEAIAREVARVAARAEGTVEVESQHLGEAPGPGDVWSGSRGSEEWVLSKACRNMNRSSDGQSLGNVVGAGRAAALVSQFLGIRPSGGRVWVDADGAAVTYVGGDLVYLGSLTAPTATAMAPGTALPAPLGGVRYILKRSDVEDPRTGKNLSDALGAAKGREVAQRLCTGRPEGGRIWVRSDGTVSTRKGDMYLYLGMVEPAEWF